MVTTYPTVTFTGAPVLFALFGSDVAGEAAMVFVTVRCGGACVPDTTRTVRTTAGDVFAGVAAGKHKEARFSPGYGRSG
jgi:hypothetical protein